MPLLLPNSGSLATGSRMDEQLTNMNNQKRASWRSMCRRRLAQHICKIMKCYSCYISNLKNTDETLGIQVKPSEVRLRPNEDGLQYAWKVDDPSLESLFDKHLSKHSVGAYMQLYREVGQSFHAVHFDSVQQVLVFYRHFSS